MNIFDKNTSLEKLNESAMLMGLSLAEDQLEKFIRYYELLIDANSRFNLTAITEWDDVLKKHFLDSLSPAPLFPPADDTSVTLMVADVGTGAGFPGIPLKIAFDNISLTLIESIGKKADFLNSVIDELQLPNVQVICDRAENVGRDPEFRGKYDLVTSRAVSSLNVICEYCVPLLKVGGEFLSYKGPEANNEIDNASNAFERLGCSLSGIYEPYIPYTDFSRSIISIRKDAETPQRYPRRAGLVAKKPL